MVKGAPKVQGFFFKLGSRQSEDFIGDPSHVLVSSDESWFEWFDSQKMRCVPTAAASLHTLERIARQGVLSCFAWGKYSTHQILCLRTVHGLSCPEKLSERSNYVAVWCENLEVTRLRRKTQVPRGICLLQHGKRNKEKNEAGFK